MTTYDFVHLALLAVGGEVRGKTKLQKTVYFLGLLTGQLEGLGYRAHYYGPYSDDVADAVRTLDGLGFADRSTAGMGSYDPMGFEVKRTDYKLSPAGMAIGKQKTAKNRELWERLQKAARQLKETAGNLDYIKLSVLAKTYFLLKERGRPATERELKDLAKHFGWDVKEEQILEAASYLKKLGLAKSTN
jgi:uncharacterized protein YwgA